MRRSRAAWPCWVLRGQQASHRLPKDAAGHSEVVGATGWLAVHPFAEKGQLLQLVSGEIARNVDALTAHDFKRSCTQLTMMDARQPRRQPLPLSTRTALHHLQQPPGKACLSSTGVCYRAHPSPSPKLLTPNLTLLCIFWLLLLLSFQSRDIHCLWLLSFEIVS